MSSTNLQNADLIKNTNSFKKRYSSQGFGSRIQEDVIKYDERFLKLHWNTSAEDLNVEKVIFDKSASRIELSFFVVGVNRWGFDWSDIKLREQTCLYAESD